MILQSGKITARVNVLSLVAFLWGRKMSKSPRESKCNQDLCSRGHGVLKPGPLFYEEFLSSCKFLAPPLCDNGTLFSKHKNLALCLHRLSPYDTKYCNVRGRGSSVLCPAILYISYLFQLSEYCGKKQFSILI